MGMYDMVSDELFCPFCGEKQEPNSFQTKDFDCVLSTRLLKEWKQESSRFNIYTECKKCGKWVELLID